MRLKWALWSLLCDVLPNIYITVFSKVNERLRQRKTLLNLQCAAGSANDDYMIAHENQQQRETQLQWIRDLKRIDAHISFFINVNKEGSPVYEKRTATTIHSGNSGYLSSSLTAHISHSKLPEVSRAQEPTAQYPFWYGLRGGRVLTLVPTLVPTLIPASVYKLLGIPWYLHFYSTISISSAGMFQRCLHTIKVKVARKPCLEVSNGRDYMSSLRMHISCIRRSIECVVLMTDTFINCLFQHHLV